MTGIKKVIEQLKLANPKVKIMIGGAPVSQEIADEWGADGYGQDASSALDEALKLIAILRDMETENS